MSASTKVFSENIVCCYLYPITKYGYPPPAADTVNHLAEMKALGFKSVELEGIHGDHLMEVYAMRDEIKEALESMELNLPYFCAVLPGLSASDREERKRNLELFESGCEIARHFGAMGILDNGPVPPYAFPTDIPVTRHYEPEVLRIAKIPIDLDWDQYWSGLSDTFRTACDIAKEYGLTYQIHPATGVMAATADGFLLFSQAVGRDNLRFNFDVSNLYAFGEDLTMSILRLKDHIDYIHVSGNGGERVEHIAVGDGVIPWGPFFEVLRVNDITPYFGIDVGGAESGVQDLDDAYRKSAQQIQDWI